MKRSAHFMLPCTALLAGLMLVSLAGCYSPYAGKPDLVSNDEYPQIVASRYTYKNLRFGPPVEEVGTPEKPMRVTVPVRSTFKRTDLNIQYRFEFLDFAGRPLQRSGVTEWRYKALPPRNQVFLDANALDVGAKDWRLEVRLAE